MHYSKAAWNKNVDKIIDFFFKNQVVKHNTLSVSLLVSNERGTSLSLWENLSAEYEVLNRNYFIEMWIGYH